MLPESESSVCVQKVSSGRSGYFVVDCGLLRDLFGKVLEVKSWWLIKPSGVFPPPVSGWEFPGVLFISIATAFLPMMTK